MEDTSSGFWRKQVDGASKSPGAKFSENVLELREEGSRGPELQMGQSRRRSLLSPTGAFERSQEGCQGCSNQRDSNDLRALPPIRALLVVMGFPCQLRVKKCR